MLAAFSLLMPWYVLRAGSLTGDGKSGAQALGAWALVLVVLGVAAGWSLMSRVLPVLPAVAASALAIVVVVKMVSPPAAAGLFNGVGSGDAMESAFARALARALTGALGLHFALAWGIWLAAIGAGMALVGTAAMWLDATAHTASSVR